MLSCASTAMVVLYALVAFLMTLAGGAFALYHRERLHYIMAFSSGLLIGVVFIDLIPEIFIVANRARLDLRQLMLILLAGFVGIFLLEKLTLIHTEKQHGAPGHHHRVGLVGAGGLAFHSLLDGLAIGIAFRTGTAVGFAVLLAVVAHDFADGLNTVTLMLANRNSIRRTIALLVIDALAPVAGAWITIIITIPPAILARQLAAFAGFLLYLGASDLLPEVHEHPRGILLTITIAGIVVAGALAYTLEAVA